MEQNETQAELVADARLGRDLVSILSEAAGDGGKSESAVECLRRVLAERKALKAKK